MPLTIVQPQGFDPGPNGHFLVEPVYTQSKLQDSTGMSIHKQPRIFEVVCAVDLSCLFIYVS